MKQGLFYLSCLMGGLMQLSACQKESEKNSNQSMMLMSASN